MNILRFRQGVAPTRGNGDAEESIHDEQIRNIKNELMGNLRAYESVIFYFQQLLVWEKPMHSAIFVAFLHAVFWYLKVWSSHAAGLLATLVLVVVWLDMWKHKIWPEIRAVEPDPEEGEWGELHPRLLSLPELCVMSAEVIVTVQRYCAILWQFRLDSPGKFAAACSAACILTIMIGKSVPGTLIAYIIMLCCLMWPLLWYRRWIERAYSQLEPFLMQLQYSLKPRMKRNGKKSSHITRNIDGTSVEVHTDSSSSDDDDISEFVKPLNAVTTEVLARALTDDDELSESDESLLAHEVPSFSHPSILNEEKGQGVPVPIPNAVPAYSDPSFSREMLEGSDDELGLPTSSVQSQGVANLAEKIMTQTTADMLTTAMKNALGGALNMGPQSTSSGELQVSRQSTPSDDGFVLLQASDVHD